MKILYDIALLGRGHRHMADRTGLFRFAEETLKHLAANKEFDLYFTTSQLNFTESEAYLAENFPKLVSKLIMPKRYSLGNILLSVTRWSLGNIGAVKAFSRTIVKIEHHLGFILEYLNIPFTFAPKGYSFDAYFSPKYQIPNQVMSIKKMKKIIFMHDLLPVIYPQYSPPSSKFLYKHLIKSLSNEMLILCNSNTTKDDLLRFRPDLSEKLVKVLPLSTSEIFKPTTKNLKEIKAKYKIPSTAKYLLTVSSLNPRKNFPHVIRCFISFIKKYNIADLYLVVTGPKGWDFKDIFKTIDELGSYGEKIILTGFVDEDEMPALYSGALSSICASLYEGFGYPALESMQCGTPAIVSDNSSLAEIVADAGIQISPQDQDALIEAMHKIYSNNRYRNSLAKAAIDRAKIFDAKSFASNLAKLIKIKA